MRASRIVSAGAVVLAVCGVLGMAPPAVQASSASAATWTRQLQATRPPARYQAMMADDMATGTVVLFGGFYFKHDVTRVYGDTWI